MERSRDKTIKKFFLMIFLFPLLIFIIIHILPLFEDINSLFSTKQIISNNNSYHTGIPGYSMIVPSYSKRIKVLEKFLIYTINNPPKSLREVIISWSSSRKEIEKIEKRYKLKFKEKNILLKYSIHTDQTVNRRFSDYRNTITNSILSIDDDIHMKPSDIELGYQIWLNHSNQIVGYNGRFIQFTKEKKLKYSYWGKVPRLIITGIAFLSKDLCQFYYDQINSENCEYVKKVNNCEDILMNFVAMKKFGLPAVLIEKDFVHVKSRGISSKQKNHLKTRSECLKVFYKSFRKLPPPVVNGSLYI